MHYELWALDTGNLIDTPESEDEALALVRELLTDGWSAGDLALGVRPDESEPPEVVLPPPLTGAELATRAEASEAAQSSSSS
jgi:hypothetical protein